MKNSQFKTGNEAAVLGAIAGGAEMFFGYPITPATEILEGWIKTAEGDKTLNYLQTEDEIAAGFGVIGAILGGKKAFTATAGVGHVLMQDPISMAESERLPFVGIIVQRGGPSTGTVIFSQQEVDLAALGGNGDGLRIVYSAGSVSEVYSLSAKIFSTAWKYRFPTLLLSDGYIGKERTLVELPKPLKPFKSEKILKEIPDKATHIRNCYGSEPEFAKVLRRNIDDYKILIHKISECESYKISTATDVIVAHGSVAEAAKSAVDLLRESRIKAGLLRPITLRPLDCQTMFPYLKSAKRIYLIESAFEQFARLLIYKMPEIAERAIKIFKPAEGFTPEEIEKIIKEKRK
ncbi:ferredoxin oxidoreductase [Candidatus Berkelbacteria bacterium CG11_big_fil_rev_8_21_14_0_20_42_15]|uniref:Ferredoxin oxidoreductase n=1 Tax=Candidatus Berkelbacteria bacterium CG11_big_fil_rev_8_21_14_0_20_42_15 TaxID=1974517 RepID=A0A2H0PZU8_9BACT|nr:MAG: ferredoxin oxidoreductase [Candidatus Berkelbacteria bacterium CG11_big_fil_rev_8_21_14_0_20_42_15]